MTLIDVPVYTLEEHKQICERIAQGSITAEELKAAFRRLTSSLPSVQAELSRKTLKELAPNGTRGATKAQVVARIASNMQQRFALGQPISYMVFQETFEQKLAEAVEKITDEQIRAYAQAKKEQSEKYRKALTDPQTREEFEIFVEYRGEAKLTSEQKARWDEIRATQTQTQRRWAEEQRAVVARVELGDVKMELTEGYHDKQQKKLWVVKLDQRVERDTYQELLAKAKRLGGWFSSFKKSQSGFHFWEKDLAERFMALKEQDQSRLDLADAKKEA